MVTEVKKKIYPQRDLVKLTVLLLNDGRPDFAKVTKESVQQTLDAYEAIIKNCLQEAVEPNTEITVQVFNGLKLIATYVPARIVKMYGSIRKARAKVACKARVSKYFKHFILNENKTDQRK